MKLVVMQPYLFPYIGYFQLLAAADRFVVYDDVQFIKGGWINRNQLLVNGQPWLFTVPLDQPSPNRLICDIEVQPAARWQPKLLQTIAQNYRRAPHFEAAFALVEQILTSDATTIADLVRTSLRLLIAYLGLPVELVPTSTVYSNADLRAQSRVLDICVRERATEYINAMGGRSLYQGKAFHEVGVQLLFLQPELASYPQQTKERVFVPGLSIIDVLMNNSVDDVCSLLHRYTLLPPHA